MGMAVEDNEIFVVDDDPAVRDALRVVFELEGYRVSAFPYGLSFLRLRNRTPGCVCSTCICLGVPASTS